MMFYLTLKKKLHMINMDTMLSMGAEDKAFLRGFLRVLEAFQTFLKIVGDVWTFFRYFWSEDPPKSPNIRQKSITIFKRSEVLRCLSIFETLPVFAKETSPPENRRQGVLWGLEHCILRHFPRGVRISRQKWPKRTIKPHFWTLWKLIKIPKLSKIKIWRFLKFSKFIRADVFFRKHR